ncbi:vacuolar subtilisin-like protease [Moelleriella libera RCEF 2490]|uniref:Vacuolar subtilisin-like protease n=1 Tax=Moelleriella libera RCEF 2490 TaxID=1081109 RepID=A0A166USV1_9HYPO|nr:vacuolar subtilisin-like protease [Moelleriella libera RCEF 2490]
MRTIIALSVAAVAQAAISTETIHKGSAPVLSSVDADVIPDSYIIKFKDHVDEAGAIKHHVWIQGIHTTREEESEEDRLELRKRSLGSSIVDAFTGMKHIYNIDGFKGYSGHFHESVIEQVRNHADVEFIEKDTIARILVPVTSEKASGEKECKPGDTELSAPWGLARISHREGLGFSNYNKYLFASEGGEGVDAYVIDTGTNVDHVDFEGRAKWGKTIPSGDADEDGNGHGTHCSGTIAGKKYGVAKKAHVYAVKVLRSNGSGSMSDVVKGVEYAATTHQEQVEAAKAGKRKGFKGSVANMSLGGGKTAALDAAVNAAVKAGIHFAVAAGNDNADACNYSPAAAELPVTVGASTIDDTRAYFSNYGKCTDIFAPGLNILSTWIGSKYAVNTISGTSMASPHICGLLAYYLSLQPAKDSEFSVAEITPKQLKETLVKVSTEGTLTDIPADTPNLLAWNGGGCNNYSKIVAEGGFKSSTRINEIEQTAKDEITKALKGVEKLGDEAQQLVGKVHDFMDNTWRHFSQINL